MRCRNLCVFVVSLVLFDGCSQRQKTPPLFRQLTPDQTGVRFANTITTTDSENVQTDVYVYNGAGVAIGDIDNDGLPEGPRPGRVWPTPVLQTIFFMC